MVPVISFAGYSNSGKTTVIEQLIRVLKERGYRVAAVKHAGHGYEIDLPGKDSYRYFQAGADQVIVVGPSSLTIHERLTEGLGIKDICERIKGEVDLILVEGFKKEPIPKVEVFREDHSPRRLSSEQVIAVVSDTPLEDCLPCFTFGEIEKLADFVISYCKLSK
ncbi:MAG: Molybdopterin-guanine dinucleotide biosynthesis protein B [Thermoanaerobacterales bacterium 50_218]|nr:MAG: Molybdopterin-guanine dinucleotide biosynthesis protein B [Thermoanaerobacterales bacterium 50_218]HAA90338.1 molybdopterin-guanine dinucleotide biosynthesis protein B [Peptococcaceae bacterium]